MILGQTYVGLLISLQCGVMLLSNAVLAQFRQDNFNGQIPWWQRQGIFGLTTSRPTTNNRWFTPRRFWPTTTTTMAPQASPTSASARNPRPVFPTTDPRTVITFRPTTRPVVVNENVFLEPNCFAQPNCTAASEHRYAFVSGICNNHVDANRGRVGRPYKRLLPPDYGDSKGSPRQAKNGEPLPSARKVSLSLNLDDSQIRSTSISRMMPWWGQFVTHEITKALRGRKPSGASFACVCGNPEHGCHNIPLEKNDIRYIREAELCIQVERTEQVPNTDCDSTIREQKNSVSSYLDAGTVYGDSESDFDQLLNYRSDIGELLTGDYADEDADESLPLQSQVHRDFGGRVQCEAMIHKPPAKPCLLAGDTRANENTALSAAHLLLMRKHNLIVKDLSELNPSWDRMTLAQEARKIITALMQHITYQEFLPVILGDKYIRRFNLAPLKTGYWKGYDATVDATISNSFAAAAFRFGHTTLTKFLSRTSPDWITEETEPLRVKDSMHGSEVVNDSTGLKDGIGFIDRLGSSAGFFNNEPLLEQFQGGVNSVLRGMAKDATQLTGTKMVEDLREFLFAPAGRPGKDLFAINIQRGRDHGIPGYNDFREMCGLDRAKDFADMPEIPMRLQEKLKALYKHVDDIDLYVGGLAERIDGGAVGPTYACIIGYQFRDLRLGDRFWYENDGMVSSFTQDQIESIRKYSLARLLCDTMSDMRSIQPRPMSLASERGNARKFCGNYPKLDLRAWNDHASTSSQSKRTRKADTEWSVWFPCVDEDGNEIPVTTTLNNALQFRTDEICRDIISTQTRQVNFIAQVRVECPAGSIKASDYPYIDSGYEVYWTSWKDDSNPVDGDDTESPPNSDECPRPLAIQVQTTQGTPSKETNQVFEVFGASSGFSCRGKHQTTSICADYRVRYLCRKSKQSNRTSSKVPKTTRSAQKPCPTVSTATTPPSTTTRVTQTTKGNSVDRNKIIWTPWSNTDTPAGSGDSELLINVAEKAGFCRNPLYIDARVVGTRQRARESGDVLDKITHLDGLICQNFKQRWRMCQDYEVRYLCRNGDINKDDVMPQSVVQKTKEFCRSYGVCC